MKKYETKRSLIAHFLRGSTHWFVLALVFAALVSLFDMVSPKVISFAVDSVIGTDAPALPAPLLGLIDRLGGIGTLRANLLFLAIAVALIGASAAIARYFFRTCTARGAERFVQRTRDELFDTILCQPYAWHAENSTGDLIQRCTSDVQTIKRFVSEQMIQLIRTSILIVLAVAFMFATDARVALMATAFLPFILAYSFFFHKKVAGAFETCDTQEGVLSAIAQENLTGVRVVRAFGREAYERARFEKQNTYYTGLWIHLIKLLSVYWSTSDIIICLQRLVVILAGAAYCVNGSLTVGSYIALVAYNLMLSWPVRSLGRVISEMSKAGVSIDRLRYIMNAPAEKDAPSAVSPPLDRDIVFDRVSFGYSEETGEVLHDVSLTIPAGSTVGILGGTGSGKSTLMYLLERLYELPKGFGKITIGGVDIKEIRLSHLRRGIGLVLQEPYLFSRSLSENIGIAAGGSDARAIREAAKVAHIHGAITGFTAGYDTFVGERGVTLSGGQKQRTAIAQMLVRRPPIMVFDASLSAVDAETDQRIRAALRENIAGSTVILIAHRITTLMNADRIIVLDRGRIAEAGTHEELLAAGGLYRNIYDLQTNHQRSNIGDGDLCYKCAKVPDPDWHFGCEDERE